MRRSAIILAALSAVAFASSTCFAQAQGLFSNSGTTQNRQTTGTSTGLGTGQGASTQPGGGIGTGAGLSQDGESGVQFSELGALGAQIGQQGFVGQANGTTGQFIGVQQGAAQGQGTTTRFTQGGGQGGQGFQPEQPQGTERHIRPRYRIAFDYDTLSMATVTEHTRQQVQTFRTTYNLPDSITVELDDSGTLTLRGEAESSEMSRLIANVVRLEPGVRDVKNELVVPGEDAEPAP